MSKNFIRALSSSEVVEYVTVILVIGVIILLGLIRILDTNITAVILTTLTGYVLSRASRSLQLKRSSEEIAQAEERIEAQPDKAKPVWDLARASLEAYFTRNLSQISTIFWLSVVVMVVGFGTIIWGISQATQSPGSVTLAAISVSAGVITEFIGATFLFIYRSAIDQAIKYSKTLERINSVGMAMSILDTMPAEIKPDDLKSKTKANLVELIVQQANKGSEAG